MKSVVMGGIGIIVLPGVTRAHSFLGHQRPGQDDLLSLADELLDTWGDTLLKQQITSDKNPALYGGLMCPACKIVHGRVADSIYPLVHLAHKKQDSRYMDAAKLLYQWMEQNVSEPDGSWRNETKPGAWKGITVFTVMSLAETLKHYGNTLAPEFKVAIINRLKTAGEFLYTNFSMDYGNINYPVSAAYALTLLGLELNIPKFIEKGKSFARGSLKFFSANNSFLYGEGKPYYEPSKKGCFSVDLGYNLEESLPALVSYGLLVKDDELLEKVHQSLQTHLEFMLPDGAIDNSWGTRSFKWTYWGSRTADGCQLGLALMAHKDPRYYKAALRNLQLLKQCTQNGLLHGGPHYVSHGVQPCIHHTFCHAKTLAALHDNRKLFKVSRLNAISLPREQDYGVKFFKDIQTWLVSVGEYRATITGYDREYTMRDGHPTGGALSMLWHAKTGPIVAASMNKYHMQEPGNMQPDNDPNSMHLTPRIELKMDGKTYMNISDLSARIEVKEQEGMVIVETVSALVDSEQNNPPAGKISCKVSYHFSKQGVKLLFAHDGNGYGGNIKIICPVISKSTEQIKRRSSAGMSFSKEKGTLHLSANQPIQQLPTQGGRIFNFVPGMEAVPLGFSQREVEILLKV